MTAYLASCTAEMAERAAEGGDGEEEHAETFDNQENHAQAPEISKRVEQALAQLSEHEQTLVRNELQRVKEKADKVSHMAENAGADADTAADSEPVPMWRQRVERALWLLLSVAAIVYGDGRSDLLQLLLYDGRVNAHALMLALATGSLAMLIGVYLVYWLPLVRKDFRDWETASPAAIPTASLAGVLSNVCMVISLWPVFGWLSLVLQFVLFNGFVAFFDCFKAPTLAADDESKEKEN